MAITPPTPAPMVAKWQRDAAGLNQALTEISRLMSQAAANYESTDTQIANTFGR